MNNWICVSFSIWFPRGICIGVGLLGHMVVLFRLLRNLYAVFHSGLHSHQHSLFSTPSPAFIVCRLFDDGHFDWCEVISHCGFDLHFSNNERCWASFHVFICISSLEKCLLRSFSHLVLFFLIGLFVFLVLSCTSCLYILEINPMSVVYFAIIFSHFWGFSFHPAYSFLCCAKDFKFNQVPLVYFCFYFHYSRRWVIEDLALIYVIKCSACFPLRVLYFLVLHLDL